MTLILDVAIRSSVILLAGLSLRAVLRKRSAALRHRVLALSLLAAAIVTPVSALLPEWSFRIPSRLGDPGATASSSRLDLLSELPEHARATSMQLRPQAPSRAAARSRFDLSLMALVVWLSGTLVAVGVLITGLLRVRRVAARAVPVDDPAWLGLLHAVAQAYRVGRKVVISQTHSADLLGTWGVLKPEVLLPRDAQNWTNERMRVVLCHELAHIRRHDWVVQIGADLIRAVLWFNPLVWIVCRRLRYESEQACDDEVLGAGIGAREYAANLLEFARQRRRPGVTWPSAIAMAHPSTLEARITAMLNPLIDRRIPSQRALFALVVGAVLITLPVAALRARQAPPAPLRLTVYDATGAVIPGAQVALIDATETKWTATSNVAGRFELPAVAAGKYVLDVKLPGFRALRQDFELSDPRDWDRAVTLQIGTLSETVSISASRAIAPNQGTGSSDPGRIRVGGNVRVPKKEVHVAPTYPPAMIAAGLSGVVPIEAIIGVDGSVSSVRVLSAQVHPDFAIAAVDAVRQWRFTPTLLNRVPVEVAMTVTLRFDLKD